MYDERKVSAYIAETKNTPRGSEGIYYAGIMERTGLLYTTSMYQVVNKI